MSREKPSPDPPHPQPSSLPTSVLLTSSHSCTRNHRKHSHANNGKINVQSFTAKHQRKPNSTHYRTPRPPFAAVTVTNQTCSATVQYNHPRQPTLPAPPAAAQLAYALSPRMRRASCMSFGMMVTRLAWMAHRLVSSNSDTRYASAASCSAPMAVDWKRLSTASHTERRHRQRTADENNVRRSSWQKMLLTSVWCGQLTGRS